MSRPAALEKRLGHRFANPRLLEQALTHRSCGADNYERLEFLGDGVLGCAVADELYGRFPQLSEGKLTRLRASLVREEALAEVAGTLGIAELLRLGEGELAAGPQPRPSILADALEAVIGAVFLDGGYEAARKAVLAAFGPLIDQLDPERPAKDAKTRLQEILQAQHRRLPDYRVVSVRGEAHRQSFEVECLVQELGLTSTGTGTSRQRAEQQAAKAMLEKLEK
ncbi:MAG: ribonuclease III [Betaproteobacteria bacterium]|nr:MAG: ribonuclease III [Betaproteobacteria bacterium]